MKWLIPRLERQPAGLQVQIVATRDRADLIAGDADMAIRFGMGNYPGLAAQRLFDEMVVPLAAPSLLADGLPLDGPRDLCRQHSPQFTRARTGSGAEGACALL